MVIAVELAREPLEPIHAVYARTWNTYLVCYTLEHDGRDMYPVELQEIRARLGALYQVLCSAEALLALTGEIGLTFMRPDLLRATEGGGKCKLRREVAFEDGAYNRAPTLVALCHLEVAQDLSMVLGYAVDNTILADVLALQDLDADGVTLIFFIIIGAATVSRIGARVELLGVSTTRLYSCWPGGTFTHRTTCGLWTHFGNDRYPHQMGGSTSKFAKGFVIVTWCFQLFPAANSFEPQMWRASLFSLVWGCRFVANASAVEQHRSIFT